MQQSHVIDIAGVFAGAAVLVAQGYRFIAVNPGLSAIDGREFADLEAVRRAIRERLVAAPASRPAAAALAPPAPARPRQPRREQTRPLAIGPAPTSPAATSPWEGRP
jgi:hypothetical protein